MLDGDRRELRRGANTVNVAPQVFDLLDYLIRNRERVISKDDLIAAIWRGRIVSDAALTTRINVARAAIGDSGEAQHLIKTLPRKGFRFVGVVREEIPSSGATATVTASIEPPRTALALPDRPSIAVLPFINLSGDAEQEYLADGIVEDVIIELSRFNELFVIARNSSFQYKGKATDVRKIARELGVRYVLEGSVRRSGSRIRIAAQLIDAATGAHRWAERYDRKLEDVFALQDEVVHKIATILAAHVRKAETERARAKPPTSWAAYDCYLKAAEAFAVFHTSFSVEDLYEARLLLQRSLAIDPNYARSHTMLANTFGSAWVNPLDSDFLNRSVLERALEHARTAARLDASLPETYACLGNVLMWKHEHERSIAAFEKAAGLNPNYVDWPFGVALIFAGQPKRAIEVFEAYMRLDPFYAPVTSGFVGWAFYMLKQYKRALPILQDCVTGSPRFRSGHVFLAATYARLGQRNKARAEAFEVLRLQPNYTIAGTARRIVAFKSAKDDKHFFEGLRMAGLPE